MVDDIDDASFLNRCGSAPIFYDILNFQTLEFETNRTVSAPDRNSDNVKNEENKVQSDSDSEQDLDVDHYDYTLDLNLNYDAQNIECQSEPDSNSELDLEAYQGPSHDDTESDHDFFDIGNCVNCNVINVGLFQNGTKVTTTTVGKFTNTNSITAPKPYIIQNFMNFRESTMSECSMSQYATRSDQNMTSDLERSFSAPDSIDFMQESQNNSNSQSTTVQYIYHNTQYEYQQQNLKHPVPASESGSPCQFESSSDTICESESEVEYNQANSKNVYQHQQQIQQVSGSQSGHGHGVQVKRIITSNLLQEKNQCHDGTDTVTVPESIGINQNVEINEPASFSSRPPNRQYNPGNGYRLNNYDTSNSNFAQFEFKRRKKRAGKKVQAARRRAALSLLAEYSDTTIMRNTNSNQDQYYQNINHGNHNHNDYSIVTGSSSSSSWNNMSGPMGNNANGYYHNYNHQYQGQVNSTGSIPSAYYNYDNRHRPSPGPGPGPNLNNHNDNASSSSTSLNGSLPRYGYTHESSRNNLITRSWVNSSG